MAKSQKTNAELSEENVRLRAQVAQLEDRLDHLSEHGAAAKSLRQMEMTHREVMSVVSDVVLIADDSRRLTYVSPNAHYIFGHSAAEIMKHGRVGFLLPKDMYDPDELAEHGEIVNIVCQVRDAVGRARNLLVTVRQMEETDGCVMFICRDVSERMKIELDNELLLLTLSRRVEEQTKELRESLEQYRRRVEGLRDEYLFYATDSEGTVTYISPSIYTILGRTPDQVLGHNWREFVDQTDASFAELEELERLRFAGLPIPSFVVPVPHENGEVRIFEFRDTQVRDEDGRVIASEGIGKNVTERHRAEEELRRVHEELEQRVKERTAALTEANAQLRESERRYRSVVEDHVDFIIRWQGDGMRTFANKSYCRFLGASLAEILDTSFMDEIVEEDRERLKEKLAQVAVANPVVVFEHRTVLTNGRTVWQHWSHRALFDEKDNLIEYQSVGSDVTDRRKRDELMQDRAVAIVQLGNLSERERDVMRLVVAGSANKVIAKKLDLSVKTIEKHRSSMMKKLRVRSVAELVRLGLLAEEGNEN